MDILDSHIELLTLRFSFYLDHLGTGGLQDEFWVFLLAPTAFFIFPLFNNFQHTPPPQVVFSEDKGFFFVFCVFLRISSPFLLSCPWHMGPQLRRIGQIGKEGRGREGDALNQIKKAKKPLESGFLLLLV